MINFEELIKSLILPLVAYPNDVIVTCSSEEEDNLDFQVKVNSNDLGRVIKNISFDEMLETLKKWYDC